MSDYTVEQEIVISLGHDVMNSLSPYAIGTIKRVTKTRVEIEYDGRIRQFTIRGGRPVGCGTERWYNGATLPWGRDISIEEARTANKEWRKKNDLDSARRKARDLPWGQATQAQLDKVFEIMEPKP